ncbi:hypothetical protein [Micromonospora sp. NPDC049679]|uniref:hypothetical protein n=1 Tax=Micromonospora sp. NPDC049679 TaxID=3155920 RepID=UPI0033E71213
MLLAVAALGVGGLVLAVVGYLVIYFCAGVPGPLGDEVLHDRSPRSGGPRSCR